MGTNAASVSFSSIPASYTDLVLVCSVRSTANVSADLFGIQFNGVGNTGLSNRTLYAWGTTVASTTASVIASYGVPGALAVASLFGAAEFYIPNYASTLVTKPVALTAVSPDSGSANASNGVAVGQWANTAAITSITCLCSTGSLLAGSTFYLYGIAKP